METNQLFNLLTDGENFAKENCPELYQLIHKKAAPLTRSACDNENGFQDTTEIQNILFNNEDKTLQVNSVAGFKEKKGVIAIVSEVIDSATNESIKGAAVTTKDAYFHECNIVCQLKNHNLLNSSNFYARTVFYWTEIDDNGEVVMKSHEERKNCGIVSNGEDDIVDNITVEFPNTLKPRDRTIVLYNRTAEAHVEDPDKVYSNISVINNKLQFHLPFIGSVRLKQGKIIGVDREKAVIKLQHPEKKTSVTFNKDKDNNWKDIKWKYENGYTLLHWTFPEDWKNQLDLKDLSIHTTLDFYACLPLIVNINGAEVTVNTYVGSNIEEDKTHCKIQKVFLQWGCLGKNTLIMMADGTYKIISNLRIGELVNTGKGIAEIYNIYSGHQLNVVNLETESGKRLLMTNGHPVLTERGWVRAENLNASDKVINAEGKTEALKALFPSIYDDKIYNLQLNTEEHQFVAEGIVVGDFMLQNTKLNGENTDNTSIKGQETLASEFETLVDEINRCKNW